ncbi:MAG: GNAT family N-acyltransferase [Candidatus Absconditabacterales bacterium]|jgi:hypothetical protein
MKKENFQAIIPPVDPCIIGEELRIDDRKSPFFVRYTRAKERRIYKFTANDCPRTMEEIARLREITFRDAGGGTGKDKDIDEYDIGKTSDGDTTLFTQLILLDPVYKKILAAYRYALGSDIIKHKMKGPTLDLFDCSDSFVNNHLPYGIELGRSFVIPELQKAREGIFVFDGMMDGLGSLVVDFPHIKYFFGKFTMYTDYNTKARDLILYYLKKHFGDKQGLLIPKPELAIHTDETGFAELFPGQPIVGRAEERKILTKKVRELGEDIPPLVNYYESLSPTMLFFETAINNHFGEVEESGIEVTIDDIYEEKKARHVMTYDPHAQLE